MADKLYLLLEDGGKTVLESELGAILLETSGTGEVGVTGAFSAYVPLLLRRRRRNTVSM